MNTTAVTAEMNQGRDSPPTASHSLAVAHGSRWPLRQWMPLAEVRCKAPYAQGRRPEAGSGVVEKSSRPWALGASMLARLRFSGARSSALQVVPRLHNRSY